MQVTSNSYPQLIVRIHIAVINSHFVTKACKHLCNWEIALQPNFTTSNYIVSKHTILATYMQQTKS